MSAGTVVLVEETIAGSELVGAAPRVANPIPNPSFEVDLATWVTVGGTPARVVGSPSQGAASLHVVGSSSGHGVDYRALNVESGRRYYAAFDVTAYASGPNASLRISDGAGVQKVIVSRSSVGLLEVEVVADATATDWRLRILTNGGAGDFNADAVRFGEIDAAGQKIPYADGSLAGYSWAGTAHNSATLETGALYVADPTDFQPEGGELLLAGLEEKGYSALDEATGRITLDSGPAGSYVEGDRVDVLPLTTERFAHVQLEGQDEVLVARVPHGLYDRLPIGARDENVDDAELVELGRDPSGELVVADVLNREPIIDGTFVDVGGLDPVPTTDGVAPSSSPTPTIVGGVRSLFVKWTPISNADPVTYEVHVSTSSGFTPSPATFAGQVDGTLFVVRTLPGTLDPPAYDVDYFVRLVATDADGVGPAGTEAFGRPAKVDGNVGDIIVNGVLADQIVANDALFAKLQALLIIANTLATAESGQRVEIDTDGIRLVSSIEQVLVDLPTDPVATPAFRGTVETGGLVVLGNALLQGTDNVLDAGAAITMLANTTSPTTAPTLSHDWESSALASFSYVTTSGIYAVGHGLYRDPSGFSGVATYLSVIPGGAHEGFKILEHRASDGALLRAATSASLDVSALGIVRSGSTVWVLARSTTLADTYYLIAFAQSTLAQGSTVDISANMPAGDHDTQDPTLGTDGTDLLLLTAESVGTGGYRLELRRFNSTTAAFISSHDTNLTGNELYPRGVTLAAGNLWLYYTDQAGVAKFDAISTSTYNAVANETSIAYSSAGWGIVHDGTRFFTARFSGGVLTRHSTWTFTTPTTLYVGYTWADATHETTISPRGSQNMFDYRRSRVKITRPGLPPGGPDRVRIYAAFASSPPASSALKRQSATSFVTSETANPLYLIDLDGAGAAPPTTNTYAGNPSGIKNNAGQVLVGSNWERYILVAAPFTKGISSTLERTLVELTNNLPNLVAPLSANEAGALYEFELAGLYDHGTGGNLTIRVKIGSTVLESRAIAAPGVAQTGQGWFIRGHLVVKTTGPAGSVNGAWLTQFAGAGAPTVARGFSGTDLVVDLTATQRVDITAQYGASAAANGIAVHSCRIQRVA